MNCIAHQCLPSPMLLVSDVRQIRTVCLPSKQAITPENRTGFTSVKTRAAIASSLFVATSSPPPHGSLSVLLIASSVLLFAYWITNFVVPGIIIKDLRTEESNENEDNPAD